MSNRDTPFNLEHVHSTMRHIYQENVPRLIYTENKIYGRDAAVLAQKDPDSNKGICCRYNKVGP